MGLLLFTASAQRELSKNVRYVHQDWPDVEAARRAACSVLGTKVPNTDQSSFPVLVSGTYSYLATTGSGGNVTNANGYDIVFTSDAAGSSTLAFERESLFEHHSSVMAPSILDTTAV